MTKATISIDQYIKTVLREVYDNAGMCSIKLSDVIQQISRLDRSSDKNRSIRSDPANDLRPEMTMKECK